MIKDNTISFLINKLKTSLNHKKSGLVYDPNMTVADLVNKSTTGDGIPDWEKILLGLDPTKTENVPGVPDSVTIQKMEQEHASSEQTGANTEDTGNLTQTENFSKEFFATIAALEQSGAIDENGNMDQATMDKLTSSLENSVQNSPQRKIYALSDIKIINDNSLKAIKKYNSALNSVSPKNTIKYSVTDVFKKFAPDDTGNNANPAALSELDPIIKQMTDFLNGMVATSVPQSLASLHLNAINAIEGVIENLTDAQLYSTDPIIAFSGMSKYDKDSTAMMTALQNLANAIDQKLK
jgi:hypothetical protein